MNGKKLIEPIEQQMNFIELFVRHIDLHKVSYKVPNEVSVNQINHLLIRNQHERSIQDGRIMTLFSGCVANKRYNKKKHVKVKTRSC